MTPEQRAEIMAAFTDAEQSMAWHAARGLDTTLSPEMVNDLGEKVAHLQATRNAALARAEAAEAEAARLRAALKSHEWEFQSAVSGERKLFCPACHNPKEWSSEFLRKRHAEFDRPDGHRQGCWIAEALAGDRGAASSEEG